MRGLADFHQNYDLLLTPTLATPPPRIGQFDTPRALQPLAQPLLRDPDHRACCRASASSTR